MTGSDRCLGLWVRVDIINDSGYAPLRNLCADLADSGGLGLRKFEGRVQVVPGLFEPPAAHGDTKDDHLRGERLNKVGDSLANRLQHITTGTQHRKCSRHRQTQVLALHSGPP